MKLVVGLGNPGLQYENTRHNAGFILLDLIAHRYGFSSETSKFQAVVGRGVLGGYELMTLKPQTFMNLSGKSLVQAAKFLKVEPSEIVVIHDDIDLEPGTLRFKVSGGHGGHNGVRSITQELGTADFARLRIGVGRPSSGMDVTSWVLGRFSPSELELFSDQFLDQAEERVVSYFKSVESTKGTKGTKGAKGAKGANEE